MKFRKDRPEEACDKDAPDYVGGEKWACMRIAGHAGECIARADLAAFADGVCPRCRNPLNRPHEPECEAGPAR